MPDPAEPPAPAEPLASKPMVAARRPAVRAGKPGSKGLAFVIGGLALAVFAVVAVWLANSDPPVVTHAEAVAMALRVEQARTVAELEKLSEFDAEAPASVPTPAAVIGKWKQNFEYTFVRVLEKGGRSLLFRVDNGTRPMDYHELRLERRTREIKVTDLWSMLYGGWLREILAEKVEASPLLQTELLAFHERLAGEEPPEKLQIDFERLPDPVRTSRLLGMHYVVVMKMRRPEAAAKALADYRAAHPDLLGPDLLLLADMGADRAAMAVAIERILARVPDDHFLGKLRASLGR
jgi:hypothetical protein